MRLLGSLRDFARSVSLTPSEAERHGLALNKDGKRRSAFELLSSPAVEVADLLRIWPRFGEWPKKIVGQLEIDARYDVYLARQSADIAAFRRDESLVLPPDLDYLSVSGLSNEARQKLALLRPRTIGQAGRIDGVTPATLTLLVAHLRRATPARRDRSAKQAAI
jgi:tRNA uridine 5-carboxymethylaminomethyl modification enzyme